MDEDQVRLAVRGVPLRQAREVAARGPVVVADLADQDRAVSRVDADLGVVVGVVAGAGRHHPAGGGEAVPDAGRADRGVAEGGVGVVVGAEGGAVHGHTVAHGDRVEAVVVAGQVRAVAVLVDAVVAGLGRAGVGGLVVVVAVRVVELAVVVVVVVDAVGVVVAVVVVKLVHEAAVAVGVDVVAGLRRVGEDRRVEGLAVVAVQAAIAVVVLVDAVGLAVGVGVEVLVHQGAVAV